MPFNGAGVFTRIENWVNDANAGLKILAARMDTDSNDWATAFNNSVTRDGQGSPSATTPWNSQRITGLSSAATRTDSISLGNVQNNLVSWGGTSGGSGNAQTISTTVASTAYTAGQVFTFTAGFTNTGAMTLNVNSLGTQNVFMANSALTGGEVTSGQLYQVIYDGTQFQIVGPVAHGHSLLNIVNNTTAGATTYTPTAGTNMVIVELVGGGGGGGGAANASTNTVASSGTGGGGGGYAVRTITSSFSGVTVTVGAAGTAGVGGGAAPGAGGTSSFGALLSATGGGAGVNGVATTGTGPTGALGGAGGAGSSGDVNANGESGGWALITTGGTTVGGRSGYGGGSYFSAGGRGKVTGTAGVSGVLGAGGSGGLSLPLTSAFNGGAGGVGFVRIWEYS